tara:strand:+ start:42 stop:311 length:270 start_codon:yes stop_codon:yes gene_type:complete
MHEFKHPKYYTELRKRNRVARNPMGGYSQSDQVISDEASTEATSVHPDPGPKQQASGGELRSSEPPASSNKPQASGAKRQASGGKRSLE